MRLQPIYDGTSLKTMIVYYKILLKKRVGDGKKCIGISSRLKQLELRKLVEDDINRRFPHVFKRRLTNV